MKQAIPMIHEEKTANASFTNYDKFDSIVTKFSEVSDSLRIENKDFVFVSKQEEAL